MYRREDARNVGVNTVVGRYETHGIRPVPNVVEDLRSGTVMAQYPKATRPLMLKSFHINPTIGSNIRIAVQRIANATTRNSPSFGSTNRLFKTSVVHVVV